MSGFETDATWTPEQQNNLSFQRSSLIAAMEETEEAYRILLSARKECSKARGEMGQEHSELRAECRRSRRIWDRYYNAEDRMNAQIKELRRRVDFERKEITRCSKGARRERQKGNLYGAMRYTESAEMYRKDVAVLCDEIRQLEAKLRRRKQRARSFAPRINDGAFREAAGDYRKTRRSSRSAKIAFSLSKERRDEMIDELMKYELLALTSSIRRIGGNAEM